MIDFIQVGFNKTGTTLFDEVVYAQNKNINCIQIAKVPELARFFLEKVILVESFVEYGEKEYKQIRSEFFTLYKEYSSVPQAGVNGIMYEPFTFLYAYSFDRKAVIDRLYKIFPQAKIILTIRNQKTWFVSHYSQCVKAGVFMGFRDFMRLQMKSPALDARLVNWYWLVRYIEQEFGKDKTKIILFEELKKDLQACAEGVYYFLEVPSIKVRHAVVNPSLSKTSLNLMRVINRFIRRDYGDSPYSYKRDKICHNYYAYRPSLKIGINFYFAYRRTLLGVFYMFDKLFKLNNKYRLDDDVIHLMEERYSSSNTRLANLLGKDLTKYDYP